MNFNEKYYKIGEFAKAIGKSENTLREWEKAGKLIPQRTQGGHRIYSEEQRISILQEEVEKKKFVSRRKKVAYHRIFNESTVDEMEYQLNLLKVYMAAKGYSFQVYKDISNGIEVKGTALESLIELVLNGEIERIVVVSKDVFSRFNSDIIEMICKAFGTEIEVIDNTPEINTEKLKEEGLDFIESLMN